MDRASACGVEGSGFDLFWGNGYDLSPCVGYMKCPLPLPFTLTIVLLTRVDFCFLEAVSKIQIYKQA